MNAAADDAGTGPLPRDYRMRPTRAPRTHLARWAFPTPRLELECTGPHPRRPQAGTHPRSRNGQSATDPPAGAPAPADDSQER